MIFAYDQDKIYFACGEYDLNDRKYYMNPTEENLPVWHPHEGMLIYVNTNNQRIVDLIKYSVNIPKELSFETLNSFYEDIWECLRREKYKNPDAYRLTITIANSRDAYYLNKNGITDRDDKLTPVSGGVSLELIDDSLFELTPVERIKEYIRIENEFYGRKTSPILFLSTDEYGAKLIDL